MGNRERRDSRGVTSLGENVLLFREAGFSYGAIAQHVRISKAYVIKLVQEHRAEMRRAGAGHVALTARQRRFARALLNGRSPQEAAIYAARPGKLSPEEAHAWAHVTMLNENFRLAIQQIFHIDRAETNGTSEAHPVEADADSDLAPARLYEDDDDVVIELD